MITDDLGHALLPAYVICCPYHVESVSSFLIIVSLLALYVVVECTAAVCKTLSFTVNYKIILPLHHDGMINVEVKVEIGYEGSQSVICSIVFFYPSSFSRNF